MADQSEKLNGHFYTCTLLIPHQPLRRNLAACNFSFFHSNFQSKMNFQQILEFRF